MKDFFRQFQPILFILVLLTAFGSFFGYKALSKQIQSLQQTIEQQANNQKTGNSSNPDSESPGSTVVNVVPDPTAPVLGNADAKVTLIEFADFQCPFCNKFFKQSEPEIISKYVNTGEVKFIFESFAILGAESQNAAEAAKCAQDQGKFWQYHDYLYSHQNGENQGAFSILNLKSFAKNISGLNLPVFNACLDQHKHLDDVHNEVLTGTKYGVSSTPTTFINGKQTLGVYPLQTYEQQIEDALKGK